MTEAEQPPETSSPPAEAINPHGLTQDAQKFLKDVISFAITSGVRRAETLLLLRQPKDLLSDYAKDPEAYADLLLDLGITKSRKVALKKDPLLAAEDLGIMLTEGDVTALGVVDCLSPEDRARLLPPVIQWSFLSDVSFGMQAAEGEETKEHPEERPFAGAVLESGLMYGLITNAEFVRLAFEVIRRTLTWEKIVELVQYGRQLPDGTPFDQDAFLAVIGRQEALDIAAQQLPLSVIWSFLQVHIAERHGLTGRKDDEPPLSISAPPVLGSSNPPPVNGEGEDEIVLAPPSIAPAASDDEGGSRDSSLPVTDDDLETVDPDEEDEDEGPKA